MTTQHNPDECARLIAEARADNRLRLLGAERELQRMRAMADQLEAAQAEIERWKGFEQQEERYANDLLEERDKLQAELEASAAKIARLEQQHDGMCKIVEATTGTIDKLNATRAELEAARKDAEHWREARRVALEGGEILKAELEAMRPVVEAAIADQDAECSCDDYGSWNGHKRKCAALPTSLALESAVDAYRAARDKADGAE